MRVGITLTKADLPALRRRTRRRERVYIAGPMRGYPDFNYPAFDHLAEQLSHHYDVVNPADLDRELDAGYRGQRTFSDYMRQDIRALVDCDWLVALPGWERSEGANIEVGIAEILAMPVVLAEDLGIGK